ncbi:erythroblast NAD(P)(+)--arginine ADP-ribosyltransferase-like [Pyrgilauda ruficollis]|uniref:erythroblast NAD(P)(+)--arginine ADP-ribosyltransferase-like n=1 Tax=Pyrgilauda ruficollis TaxID=221976 RepID=UPI001B8624C8|nr:erythroblast NAD(P)(+)--arginine ADP-ribosyltransferase-like [Pyrgilauda ruficollis]
MALLAHTLALLVMTVTTVAFLAPPKVSPLDTARDSFDDQYQGCVPAMYAKLPELYSFERQMNLLFASGWYNAQAEWIRRGSPVSPLASPWHAVALMAYTSQDLHKEFNKAVRVAGHSRQEYINNFHFKTLHFLLTQALVTLRDAQNAQCYNVFRGVRNIRFQAQRGQRVRFGQFASTSLSEPVALQFGTDTIFKVHTCHGADISQFSVFPGEEEVLIPPYETFEVTEVTRDGKMTWISLRSTGTSSNYNCALL